LTLVLLATACGTVVKRGSDVNYFLNLRIPEALAVGTIWARAHAVDPRARRRGILASYVGAAALAVGAYHAVKMADSARVMDAIIKSPMGRSREAQFRALLRLAEDPGVRLLTDSGLIDVHQGERTAFGDPFLFRFLVNSGLIAPSRMEEWIESESYDLIVTHADLASDGYASYAFGLPMALVERARRHYVRGGMKAGLFVYGRRGAVGDGRRPQ
jgi:hypothetical protein